MNREEKNQHTKEKIQRSAVTEFALHGYEAASMNAICHRGAVSKGIVYHYFDSKENLYLDCVEACFRELTVYLKQRITDAKGQEMLSQYFNLRMQFFRKNEEAAQLFCGAVLFPPDTLKEKIADQRREFDAFNRKILQSIICDGPVRKDINEAEMIRVFEAFQDFLNAGYRNVIGHKENLLRHEIDCHNALSIFLYGIIKRK
ncbi:MAG: TetR/AcrR family transcriptional regulator [Eubacteriaceae bacterium]|nr:TetR/AcrR family transcriptional regulator [Eubacteriaceae bacterium]